MALARALVNQPKVLLLDEPLGALDLKLREQMQDELKALQQRLGITFVFVTHDQGEALSMADRVAVFNDGRIVQVGTPAEIYERPRTRFVADFVGSSNVLAAGISPARSAAAAAWASLRPEKIAVLGLSGATRRPTRSGRRARSTDDPAISAPVTRVGVELDGARLMPRSPRPATSSSPAAGRARSRIAWAPEALHLHGGDLSERRRCRSERRAGGLLRRLSDLLLAPPAAAPRRCCSRRRCSGSASSISARCSRCSCRASSRSTSSPA